MSPQATLQSGAVKLVFDSRTRLPGERIEGAVELDLATAKKDGVISVRVKLRGAASAYVVILCHHAQVDLRHHIKRNHTRNRW
jgi:hypothetical protein